MNASLRHGRLVFLDRNGREVVRTLDRFARVWLQVDGRPEKAIGRFDEPGVLFLRFELGFDTERHEVTARMWFELLQLLRAV